MKIKVLVITLCITLSWNLSAEELTLDTLLGNLQNSIHFQRSRTLSESGRYDYKSSKASLYPKINGNIPAIFSYTSENNYTPYIENQKSQSYTAAPEISFSQILPTAGILTAQISNTLSMSRITESTPSVSSDPEWINSLDLSVNLLQPMFFKGAFDATKQIIDKTYENSNLNVIARNNSIVLKAVESFYKLKQAVFNLELIKIRYNRERENFKRINQEYEMGLWTRSELYQGKSILIKSETDLMEAKQLVNAAKHFLTANYQAPKDFSVSPDIELMNFEEIDLSDIRDTIVDLNPAVNQAKNMLALQRASLIISKKDSGPEFTINGAYSYLTNTDDPESNRSVFTLSLGLKGNIFDRGADNASINTEKERVKQMETELALVLIETEIEVQNLTDSLLRAEKLMELYSFQEEAAQYEFERGLKDLELGQITEKDLSGLQIDLENAKLKRQQNIFNINLGYIQLIGLTGEDLLDFRDLRN